MAKLTLADVANLLGNPTSAANTINNNSALIEAALENTLSRDGTSPNQMLADLDMNHNDILNANEVYTQAIYINGEPISRESALWIVGTGVPDPTEGQPGDMYLDSNTGDVYGPKIDSNWGSPVANLIGPQGPAGPGSGDMLKSENLSGLASIPTARLNVVVPTYVNSIAALKALDTTKDKVAVLTLADRSGTFVWRTGNFSAHITADPQNGIYAKANAIASTSGAWVRSYDSEINLKWFGAVGNGSTNDATAVSAWLDVLIFLQKKGYVPGGKYRITSAISKTLTGISSLSIRGDGSSVTQFFFDGAVNGFSFTSDNGNWFLDVSPSTGFELEGIAITTNNNGTGIGLALNLGAVLGRPARKTFFTNCEFRGNDGLGDCWGTQIRLTDTTGVWFNNCRFIMGDNTNPNTGVAIEGTNGGDPSGFYFEHCEALYGTIWITAGDHVEGIYLTQCSHVAGQTAVFWTAVGESGFHVLGGHYNNNGDANFKLDGIYHWEISGALLFSGGHGSGVFYHISTQRGGGWSITGNTIWGDHTGTEVGVFVDNSAAGATNAGIISGNTIVNMNNNAILLGSGSSNVLVAPNAYGNNTGGNISNSGSGNTIVTVP